MKDTLGRELTKEQADFFKSSKVTNSGRLCVCYHGSDTSGIEEFWTDKRPVYFSAVQSYSREYGDLLYTVYLNIEHPLDRVSASDVEFLKKSYTEYCRKNSVVNPEWVVRYLNASTVGKRLSTLLLDNDNKDPNDTFYKFIKEIGRWDGVFLDEGYDKATGFTDSSTSFTGGTSFVPFYKNQVKAVDNKNPSNSPNIHEKFQEKRDFDKVTMKENTGYIDGIEYTLNPKLYDDKELKADVLEALQKIANTFIEDLQENNIPLNVVDIWLVGSNAAYNYTDKSDIDIHVIVNTEDIEGGEILGLLYNYAKADFNKKHDIKVKGLPVELYIEPLGSTAVTNGIYSIQDNRWVKYPHESPVVEVDNITETDGYKEIKSGVEEVLNGDSTDNIQDVVDDLYLIRQISLSTDGEFGLGNLIFKQIRNEGLLDALKDRKRELVDKELTLEKLQEKKNKQLQITSGDLEADMAFFNSNMSAGGCGLGESVEFDGDDFGEKIAEDVEGNIIYKQKDKEHPYSIYYYRHNTVTQPLVSMLADTLVDLLDVEELKQMYADMEKDENLLPEDWAKNNMEELLKYHANEVCEIFEPYLYTL